MAITGTYNSVTSLGSILASWVMATNEQKTNNIDIMHNSNFLVKIAPIKAITRPIRMTPVIMSMIINRMYDYIN